MGGEMGGLHASLFIIILVCVFLFFSNATLPGMEVGGHYGGFVTSGKVTG